ncbi:MAG: nucleotidyltransferase domain-containing protein [candidate division WOR-3 bacterium]|nr:nucleotidyltransferase domain-containing protein [candidate division WOR-3 bacterium]
MTAQEASIIDQLRAKLQARLHLSRLVLFGSRARGDAAPDSDLDILVILNAVVDREAEDYVNDSAWEVGLAHGVVIVPVTVSRYDWEEGLLSSSLLAIAVKQEGITV